jgi:cytochrome c biogenesis protein CcdA
VVTLERNAASQRGIVKHALVFALGAMLSSVVVSVPVGLIGYVLQAQLSAKTRMITFMTVALLLALTDLGVGGLRAPSLRRQTKPRLYADLGPRWAWFLWGLDLGLGWTTIRATSLYWIFILWALLLVGPFASAVGFVVYGLALAMSIFGSQMGKSTTVRMYACRSTRFLQLAPFITKYAGFVMVSLSGILLLGQFVGT